MPETPMAQYDKRLGQREGSEAVEGRPSAHVLFVALGDSSVQPVQKDKSQTEPTSAGRDVWGWAGREGADSSHTQGWGGLSQEPRSAASQKQPWHALPAPSAEPRAAGVRPGEACSPEHVVVAVDLVAHARGVQDAPVAHHGAADAPGAPGSEAGQEQLLLGHWGEAGHHLPHHWNTGASVQSPGRAGGPARPFSRGRGFLSGEVRASRPLPLPRVQPGSPGP